MRLLEPGLSSLAPRGSASRRGEGRILIVNGHPDPRPERFCAALCEACHRGARSAGRQADMISLGALPAGDGQDLGHAPRELAQALELVRRSNRLAVVFPLWLDKPPPLLSRFFQQAAEAGANDGSTGFAQRCAHFVVTMALPAFAHRSISRGACASRDSISLRGVETNDLRFIGSVDTISDAQREEWLDRLRLLGAQGAWPAHIRIG
jgi:putative NADPH-quinone reductase